MLDGRAAPLDQARCPSYVGPRAAWSRPGHPEGVVRDHDIATRKRCPCGCPRFSLGQVPDVATDCGSQRRYPIEQPQHGELGVAMMERRHVLPPWGAHREGLELAEHRPLVIAGHESHHPLHGYHHVWPRYDLFTNSSCGPRVLPTGWTRRSARLR